MLLRRNSTYSSINLVVWCYGYTHLQTSIDIDQTLAVKYGIEYHASTCGVAINSYHADNDIFAEKGFQDQVQTDGQSISYCAVGAHHQNGIVERHIATHAKNWQYCQLFRGIPV